MGEARTVRWITVLPVGFDPEARERVRDALAPLAAAVLAGADDWTEALELAAAGSYDVLLVGYPLGDAPMAGFLATLRRSVSPCRRAAIVLVTEARRRGEAETYLGRGANRVIAWEEMELRLSHVIEELLRTAPRVLAELAVRIKPVVGGPAPSVPCRTVNISASGMLLRVPQAYVPGTVLVFEMMLPGTAAPVRGHARVVRRTSVRREPFPGVGVAFAGFDDNTRSCLDSYLDRASA